MTLLFAPAQALHVASPPSSQEKPAYDRIPDEFKQAEFESIDRSHPISLGLGRGKVSVLAVWASWCKPCRLALIGLNDVQKDYSNRGVEVMGLTIEEPPKDLENVRGFLNKNKIDFRLGWIGANKRDALFGEHHVVPEILVITSDGAIVRRIEGWNAEHTIPLLRAALEEVLDPMPK
jgi:thiol-disulfide isomerase/thioredoxin